MPLLNFKLYPNHIFSQLGGLQFLLLCNYNIEKLSGKLSSLHKQMLLAWSVIYKHNFSPHISYGAIIIFSIKTSTFFFFKTGIITILHMIFLMKVGVYIHMVTPREFAIVFDAIPTGVIALFRGFESTLFDTQPILDPTQTMVGKLCLVPYSSNRSIPCSLS